MNEESNESRPGNRPVASFKVKGSGVEVALWKNGDNYGSVSVRASGNSGHSPVRV